MQAADATAAWDRLVGGAAQREGAVVVYPQSLGDAARRQVGGRGTRSAWLRDQCLVCVVAGCVAGLIAAQQSEQQGWRASPLSPHADAPPPQTNPPPGSFSKTASGRAPLTPACQRRLTTWASWSGSSRSCPSSERWLRGARGGGHEL